MVVLAVKLTPLLIAMQFDVGGIDVEHQPIRRLRVRGDELRDQHLVQRPHLRSSRCVLQATQRRRARQHLVSIQRRLHDRIEAKRIVIV